MRRLFLFGAIKRGDEKPRKRFDRDGVSAQLVAALDQEIRVAENDLAIETAGLDLFDEGPGIRCL